MRTYSAIGIIFAITATIAGVIVVNEHINTGTERLLYIVGLAAASNSIRVYFSKIFGVFLPIPRIRICRNSDIPELKKWIVHCSEFAAYLVIFQLAIEPDATLSLSLYIGLVVLGLICALLEPTNLNWTGRGAKYFIGCVLYSAIEVVLRTITTSVVVYALMYMTKNITNTSWYLPWQ